MARNVALDHARLVAAFGIVWFHAGAPGAWAGYAALPFFLMVLVVLALPGAARTGFGPFARGRAVRLLGPWAIWSGVYGGLKLAEAGLTGRPLASEFAPHMLLTGPAIHLWFLPFAFAASLALWPLARVLGGTGAGAAGGSAEKFVLGLTLAGLGALALGALALQSGPAGADLPVPLAQWLFGLPAVALGAGVALARGWAGGRDGGRARAQAAAALWAAAVLGLAAWAGWTQGLEQLALALAALIFCLRLRLPGWAAGPRAAGLAAAAALGVYLAHPLVASVLLRTTPLAHGSAGFALAVLAGALALALALVLVPGPARRPAAAPPPRGLPAPRPG